MAQQEAVEQQDVLVTGSHPARLESGGLWRGFGKDFCPVLLEEIPPKICCAEAEERVRSVQ